MSVAYARSLPRKLEEDFAETMKLLRNELFQDLLVNYTRRKRVFVRAIEYEDTVTSQYLIRDGKGTEYKPEDYLVAFSRFVEENC